MPRTIRSARLAASALVLTGTALLAACGGGDSGGGVASAGADAADREQATDEQSGREAFTEEDALEFAECMRENGVENFTDPEFEGEGRVRFGFRAGSGDGERPFDPNDETFRKAQEACRDLMPDGGNFQPSPEQRAAMEDAQLEFAQCMRDKGYDVPDPEQSEGGGPMMIGPGGRFGDLDLEDPDVREAMDECQQAFDDILDEGGPRFGARSSADAD
jgi:hypothetical protein